MLTEDEYYKTHKAKLSGLTLAERKRRYAQYASSLAGERGKATSRRSRVPAVHATQSASASSSLESYRPIRDSMRIERIRNNPKLMTNDVLRAMLDPFSIESVPRIPDGEFTVSQTTKFKFNINLQSNANGGVAFFMRPTPWAAYAVSNTASAITASAGPWDNAYVSSFEYNAYAAAVSRETNEVGVMPPWATNAWSIPVIVARNTAANTEFQLQDVGNASSFFGVAAAWRPVCAGFKFTYTGAALQASGEMAVARWPGTYGVPTDANKLLRLDADVSSIGANVQEFGPTFRTVQALPGAQVYAAATGCTAVWAPNGSKAQTAWRPVKPFPMFSAAIGSTFGLYQFSDTPTTGVFILPPPCAGDPDRAMTLYDRLYTTNANAIEVSLVSGQPVIGANTLLYFQETETASAAAQNQTTSYAMRDLVSAMHTTDMMLSDNGLILIGEGFVPNATVGTIEIVIGVEYIPDTRTIQYGADSGVVSVARGTASTQLDRHGVAQLASKAARASLPGPNNGFEHFLESIVSGVEAVAGAIPRVGSALASAAPLVESLLAAI